MGRLTIFVNITDLLQGVYRNEIRSFRNNYTNPSDFGEFSKEIKGTL
jgi:hypothetical protein